MTLTTDDGGLFLVGGPRLSSGGATMKKIKVTVPVFIGGKPFAVGDVAEVDDYEARLLIGMERAILQTEPDEVSPEASAVDDAEGEDSARKGARRTR
jgi:hypothetical protein